MKKNLFSFLIFLIVFSVSSVKVNAQLNFFLEVEIVAPTPGFSDGKVIANLVGNYPNPVEFFIAGVGGVFYTTNDSLINLDEAFFNDDIYGVQILAVDTITDIYIANAAFQLFGFSGVSGEFKCDSLFGMFYSNDCDGQLYAESIGFSGGPNFIIEYRESYLPGMNTDVLPDWTDLSQTSLCSGLYSILTLNPPGLTQFYIGAVIDNTPNFNVEIFTTPSSPSFCTAVALADPNGAVGPCQYSWDGFPVSSNTDTDLCPGLYTVDITDSNLDSVAALYAVVDSNHYFCDPSALFPVDDTLFFMIENCIMDLDVMVDSIVVISVNFLSTVVQMTFKIWQNGVGTNVTGSAIFEAPEGSNFLLDITLYCLTKDIDANVFKIRAGKIESVLGIEDKENNITKIYPNPSTGFIQIAGESVAEVIFLSMNGELVYSSFQKSIDLSFLSSGIYQVVLLNDEGEILDRQKLIFER